MTIRTFLAACAAVFMVTACTSITRPQTPVAVDTLHYSEAVADARQKQMLLNIVRLRYNDPVGFLEVTSLSTSDNTEYSGGLGSSIGLDDGPFSEVLAGSGSYGRSHSPQLVYDNLRGDAYAKQLLQPLPASSIFLLSQSGWSVERLMLCCVARIGQLDNARHDARQKQMLLNIVRLRYNDPVGFLEVTSLSTSDNTEYSGGLGSSIGLDDGPFSEVLAGSGSYGRSHSPQLVYDNLRGDAYAKQLLQPLPASSIFLLSQSGWSVERLMLCCVARIGQLDNARSAAGPTPSRAPDNSNFRALAAQFRQLQLEGNMLVQVLGEGEAQRVVLKWRNEPDLVRTFAALDAGEVETLPNGTHLATISARGNENGDYAVHGRSLLGILSALSQAVVVPDAHRAYVGQTDGVLSGAGGPCRAGNVWDEINGGFFAVQSSRAKPHNARLAVPYRGYWFYIDDSCRSAKSTLDLVGHLYALQAGISGAGEGGSLLLLGQ